MGDLYRLLHKPQTLQRAWLHVRASAYRSPLEETVQAVEDFEENIVQNLNRINKQLREQTFVFELQQGVKKRRKGKNPRPIVMAPMSNRIVQRAILNVMQSRISAIREVLATETSIGGIPGRGVAHALLLIRDKMTNSGLHYVRSDISDFFASIPKHLYEQYFKTVITDIPFLETTFAAIETRLENEKSLGEDLKLFPIGPTGVAQGSPLSPLIGNIILKEFDKITNTQDVLCVRFIDDFVLIGPSKSSVKETYDRASANLNSLGLHVHPLKKGSNKTDFGLCASGFEFLGYHIQPGLFQPRQKARNALIVKINSIATRGRVTISEIVSQGSILRHGGSYEQTLDRISKTIRGWGYSFAHSNSLETMKNMDEQIDEILSAFHGWFKRTLKGVDSITYRRARGICLLRDIEQKSLDELPRVIRISGGYIRKSKRIIIYTDGAVEENSGLGGWAVVFADGQEFNGFVKGATNNRMEIQAVIEALKLVNPGSNVEIRTDSQHVCRIINGETQIRRNLELWDEFERLARARNVRCIWVKGHAGTPENERADALAKAAAKLGISRTPYENRPLSELLDRPPHSIGG